MTKLVDGRKIAQGILEGLRAKVESLTLKPRLVVFIVGESSASNSYVKMKRKRGEDAGIAVEILRYSVEISEAKLIEEISKYNLQREVCGILVQLPLPADLDRQKVLDAVDPKLDVDCLTGHNKHELIAGRQPIHYPPAPKAVLEILDRHNVDLRKGNVLLIGSGDLIGEPLAAMLLHRGIAFELANRYTDNLSELTAKAEVIVSGVGQAGVITGDMIKEGAVVIDAGTTGSDDGGLVGDVDTASVMGKASLLAPVPGGVGPITVALLLANVVNSATHKIKED